LADQFEKEDGKLPKGFTDRALDRAIEHLKANLKNPTIPKRNRQPARSATTRVTQITTTRV